MHGFLPLPCGTASGDRSRTYRGRTPSPWLNDQADHPFADAQALADALIRTVGYGRQRQQQREALEESAAAFIGGTVARGNAVPHWATPYVKATGSQDPDLYSTDLANVALTVKADVWSDDAVGIVGGAAKAKNLGKFTGICGQLYDVCVSHGKTPLVFAHHTTPQDVMEAAVDAVTGANVLICGADGQWTPVG